MATPTKPADHKTKAQPYRFTDADGNSHSLPFASKGAEKLTGRDTRNALMDGDVGQLKLGFVMLEACGAKQEAIDALYDLPNAKMLEHLGAWMQYGDGDGATLPQS